MISAKTNGMLSKLVPHKKEETKIVVPSFYFVCIKLNKQPVY